MSPVSRLLQLTVALVFAFGTSGRAIETWADKRLSITNGLLLWYDVSRQNAARGIADLAPLQSWRDKADYLFDGSGGHHDLAQPLLGRRPAFEQFNSSYLNFSEDGNFLTAQLPGLTFKSCTIFVVALPRKAGGYSAFAAASQRGRNDYTSGFNFDLGGAPNPKSLEINAEGAGFSGEARLLPSTGLPLDRWHVFSLVCGVGANGVRFYLDGAAQQARGRDTDSIIHLDEFVLGARHYSNTADRPHAQNFFNGNLTEVLVFDRALDEKERQAVEDYLERKHGYILHGLGSSPASQGAVPLTAVTNAPPVQFFLPGFSVRELPVDLNNINNVRYRPDGKLVAVGYDGRIWLLSDTDGDGLEDHVEPFWDKGTIRAPIGAVLTPPGYARGDGVFVAAKDKVALIVDTNRDDRADTEITVATWTERSEQQGVDALGVAIGPDQSVYFSLGTASFTDPYKIDKSTGQAHYRTTWDRGTVQRVAPDFSRRETVCTGIRFAVGMAFNHHGDLFCTDQEGATWLHNGNPLDELLFIEKGRHYGFPPRHPRYLPDVIDEPSVFDYAPQHQSTCGLQFNDPVNGGPVFGPSRWAGDALIAGYSRGHLWRTRLVKTAAGYVGQSQLLAAIKMLTVDACVSPRGDLIVATHSG